MVKFCWIMTCTNLYNLSLAPFDLNVSKATSRFKERISVDTRPILPPIQIS